MIVYDFYNVCDLYFIIFFLKHKSLGMDQIHSVLSLTIIFQRMTSSDAILNHLFDRVCGLYLHYALLNLLRHITAIYLF